MNSPIFRAAFIALTFTQSWNSAVFALVIDTVPVGNPGNLGWPDPYVTGGLGAVNYSFRMGTYEVTNDEYAEFLNAVDPTGTNVLRLYNGQMSAHVLGGINFAAENENGSKYQVKVGRNRNPVVFVSFYDAIRFTNWLHNGQGTGDTENGAYTIEGGTPLPSNATSIVRNSNARWWIPSESEWFKAGFHKNDGITGNYWLFATSSNTFPYSAPPPGNTAPMPSNSANFFRYDSVATGFNQGYAVTGSYVLDSTQNYLTDVGSYTSAISPYGTFDQAGNVIEWNELQSPYQLDSRGLRGGYWDVGGDLMYGLNRGGAAAFAESQNIGFRVVALPVAEPHTMLLVTPLCALTYSRKSRNALRP